MKLEHVGYNVAEPQKLMDWWCANLGFKQVHRLQAGSSCVHRGLHGPDVP